MADVNTNSASLMALVKLADECKSSGAPMGSLKMAFEMGDFGKIAEIAAEYGIDTDLVKTALPFFNKKEKVMSVPELREGVMSSKELFKDIADKITSIRDSFDTDTAGDPELEAQYSKVMGGKVSPVVSRMMPEQQEGGNELANLFIGLALTSEIASEHSYFGKTFMPSIKEHAKKLPGGLAEYLPTMLTALMSRFIRSRYSDLSTFAMSTPRKEKPKGDVRPEWYEVVSKGLTNMLKDIEEGNMVNAILAMVNSKSFEFGVKSLVYNEIEGEQSILRLIDGAFTSRIHAALEGLDGGVTHGSPSEVRYAWDIARSMDAISNSMWKNRRAFVSTMTQKMIEELKKQVESKDTNESLVRQWESKLEMHINMAYSKVMAKVRNVLNAYKKWIMNPQEDMNARPEITEGVAELPRIKYGGKSKKKDVPKSLKPYWKKHFKGRPKGSFTKAVKTLKKHDITDPKALAAWLEHKTTGKWPGEK